MNVTTVEKLEKSWWILAERIILIVLILSAVDLSFRSPYFTEQSNLSLLIWMVLAVILSRNDKYYPKLKGLFRGAVTLFITIVFVVFALILQDKNGVPYESLVKHYIVPIVFIIDWIITESNVQYKWWYVGLWVIYPIIYMIVTILVGMKSGFYPYFFFNYDALGANALIGWCIGLVAFGLITGSMYIVINRQLYRRSQTVSKDAKKEPSKV